MRNGSKLMLAAATLSMLTGSTAAAAAGPTPAPNAWMVLSVLGPARATALGGASAAAQPTDVPPPPPTAQAAAGTGFSITAEVIPFALWFGLIALALTSTGSSTRANTPP